MTILLINLPYLLSLCFAIVAAITQYKHLRALMFTFLPVITSFLNPVILCWRNTGIHKRIRRAQRVFARKVLKAKYETEFTRNDTVVSTMLLERDNGKTMHSEI